MCAVSGAWPESSSSPHSSKQCGHSRTSSTCTVTPDLLALLQANRASLSGLYNGTLSLYFSVQFRQKLAFAHAHISGKLHRKTRSGIYPSRFLSAAQCFLARYTQPLVRVIYLDSILCEQRSQSWGCLLL